jgi:hypothetical protein
MVGGVKDRPFHYEDGYLDAGGTVLNREGHPEIGRRSRRCKRQTISTPYPKGTSPLYLPKRIINIL